MRKPGSNGAETLRNLRTAAIQLLAEHGYGAMNLRMLARKVGLQASSLYNYIDSKQQLLFLLCEETTEALALELDHTLAGITAPAERLRKFVAFHLGYHIVNRKQASVLQMEMRSLTPKNYQAISKLQRRYTDQVRSIVEAGVRSGAFRVLDAEIATFALLQMLTAVTRWYRPQGRLSLDQLLNIYTDLALALLHSTDSPSPSQRLAPITRPANSAPSDSIRTKRPRTIPSSASASSGSARRSETDLPVESADG